MYEPVSEHLTCLPLCWEVSPLNNTMLSNYYIFIIPLTELTVQTCFCMVIGEFCCLFSCHESEGSRCNGWAPALNLKWHGQICVGEKRLRFGAHLFWGFLRNRETITQGKQLWSWINSNGLFICMFLHLADNTLTMLHWSYQPVCQMLTYQSQQKKDKKSFRVALSWQPLQDLRRITAALKFASTCLCFERSTRTTRDGGFGTRVSYLTGYLLLHSRNQTRFFVFSCQINKMLCSNTNQDTAE